MAAPLTALVDEQKFFPMLQSLAECLCAELEAAGGPALCYCGLWVGDQPPPVGVMNCSDGGCGVAWVRAVRTYPSVAFPEEADAARASCASPLAMEVEIGVMRCAPRPARNENVPDPQEAYDALRLYMSDMEAVRRAVKCCFGSNAPARRDWQHALGAWLPVPYGAAISGGAWGIFIG